MKVLVTGGAGFIGSHLIEYLASDDRYSEIYSLDNYSFGKSCNHIISPKVKYFFGDTKHLYSCGQGQFGLYEQMGNPKFDKIFHLGEYARISTSFKDLDAVLNSNSVGTFNILTLWRDLGCELYYAASSSKFGKASAENLSPYAWYKAKNVELIKNFSKWYKIPKRNYSIMYFYNVFGPREPESGEYSTVVAKFLKQYRSNEVITVNSPGTQKRNFTYVGDIVEGIMNIVEDKHHSCENVIANPEEFSIIELAEMFGKEYKIVGESRGERFKSYIPRNISKAIYSPSLSLREYIKREIK